MTPTQKDRRFTHKVVLYDEDVTLGPKIAADIEEDPNWELIALCATLGDLSFVLNRVTVDVLLLHLNPESDDRALRVGSKLARQARLLVLSHHPVRRQYPGPNDLLVADPERRFLWKGKEGELWALSSPMAQADPTCRTSKDIMGREAYSWLGRFDRRDEISGCNTLA